jgi:hypothetical protein
MAILASNGDQYIQFKEVIVDYITKFKNTTQGDLIDFYFLYSETEIPTYTEEELVKRANPRLYYDFYSHVIQTDGLMASFITRTMSFLKYMAENDYTYTYFIRSNITTLFDFDKLLNWLNDKPRNYFLSGTLINDVNISISFSGTNLTMSRDVVSYLTKNSHKLLPEIVEIGDDMAISSVITRGLHPYLNLINMLRIDFVELDQYATGKIIMYQKCELFDESIFCFRFKTNNRLFDIKLMKELTNRIKTTSFNLSAFIRAVNLPCYCENPHLLKLSQNIFTLEPKPTSALH